MRTKAQARASTKSTDTGATGRFSKPHHPFPVSTGRTENRSPDETPQPRAGVSSLESGRLTAFPRDSAPVIQAKAQKVGSRANVAPVSPDVGSQLHPAVRRHMETAFRADFSDVRIHQGPEAESMGAVAYTRGKDIHFAPGQYDPATPSGQKVIGHELAHVVQQRAGRVAMPHGQGTLVNTDINLEAEADLMGAKATQGDVAQAPWAGQIANRASAAQSQTPVQRQLFGKKYKQLKESAEDTDESEDDGGSVNPPTDEQVRKQTSRNIRRHNVALDPENARLAAGLGTIGTWTGRASAVTSFAAPPASLPLGLVSAGTTVAGHAVSELSDRSHQKDQDIREQAEPLVPKGDDSGFDWDKVKDFSNTAASIISLEPTSGAFITGGVDAVNAAGSLRNWFNKRKK